MASTKSKLLAVNDTASLLRLFLLSVPDGYADGPRQEARA